jgi:hypothetical protein
MAGSIGGALNSAVSTALSLVPIAGLSFSGLDVQPVRAVLSAIDQPEGTVPFDFNPAAVKLERDATPHEPANAKSSDWEGGVRISGNLIITLEGVRFVGLLTKPNISQLMVWAEGVATTAATEMGSDVSDATKTLFGAAQDLFDGSPGTANAFGDISTGSTTKAPGSSKTGTAQSMVALPKLTFGWGKDMQYVVSLRRIAVTYDRFSPAGQPLAATANLQLQGYEIQYDYTNPTSGGLPGRAAHTVVAGENLVGLATSTYGTPRSWRALAVANGLDDPLRLPPGRQLYLPSREELNDPKGVRP